MYVILMLHIMLRDGFSLKLVSWPCLFHVTVMSALSVSRPGQVFHVSYVTKPQQTDVELGPEVTHLYEVRTDSKVTCFV